MRGQHAAFLFHLENQAQRQKALPLRMLEYVALDMKEFNLPVYPIALVTCHWPGAKSLSPLTIDFPGKRVLLLDLELIVLEDLLAWDYVIGPNPAGLALSGGMKVEKDRRSELALEDLRNWLNERR